MKKHVGGFEVSTRKREVVVSMPESAEVLGLYQGEFGVRLDVLVSNESWETWVEWHFCWNDGVVVQGLSSENYVGSAVVGPGESRWHLFFVK